MKANTVMKRLWLLLFAFVSFFAEAQTGKTYSPYKIDESAFKAALAYEAAHQGGNLATAGTTRTVIRVFFRVCLTDIGNINVTESQIATDFKHLVGAYAPNNICFVNAGVDYIQKSALDTFNISNDDYHIFLPYGLPNCITVFYIDKLGGKNNSSGGGASGVTYGVPSAWTIVQKAYIGQGVLEHEVGHCLGLLHTFDFAKGLEDIDGSNGSTSADLVTDTKADPYVFEYLNTTTKCFSTDASGCTYTGTCTDPKGRSDYSPPYNNLMSYWCNGFYPTYQITAGQYTRTTSMISTASALLPTESAQTVTESGINLSSGFHMNSAVTTLTTSGSVTFTNTVLATLGAGQTVFLEPGFDAVPGAGGRVLIRHAFCDTSSNGFTLSPAEHSPEIKIPVIDDVQPLANSVSIFPNPASSSVNLVFTLTHPEDKGMLELYDINMHAIKQVSLGNNLVPGEHKLTMDIGKFSNGIYLVRIQFTHTVLQTKLVIAR